MHHFSDLRLCPCEQLFGSGFRCCRRAFSVVAPRVLGIGAAGVQPGTSQHALFGVVPPFVRQAHGGWGVRVPVSSWI